jgi:hypothetical protein
MIALFYYWFYGWCYCTYFMNFKFCHRSVCMVHVGSGGMRGLRHLRKVSEGIPWGHGVLLQYFFWKFQSPIHCGWHPNSLGSTSFSLEGAFLRWLNSQSYRNMASNRCQGPIILRCFNICIIAFCFTPGIGEVPYEQMSDVFVLKISPWGELVYSTLSISIELTQPYPYY